MRGRGKTGEIWGAHTLEAGWGWNTEDNRVGERGKERERGGKVGNIPRYCTS